jgi:ubiquinone/menaquinone biosynthesis C-methylase UbiE
MWPFAHTCSAGCPYCFSCAGVARQVARGDRWWSDDQAVSAWRNVYERYGPCYISLSGLEPGEQLELVSRVLEYHYAAMLTNLSFDVDRCKALIPPDRIEMHPTFHPHLWGYEAEPFLDRVVSLQKEGYDVPFVSMVAYPPYVGRLSEYIEAITQVVPYANVAPMRDATYQGKPYPESYTEDELRILRQCIPDVYTDRAAIPPLSIAKCGAGFAAACINLNGDVGRCTQVRGMGDQNLFRDGNIEFLPEPMPCNQQRCLCAQLHVFHMRGATSLQEAQEMVARHAPGAYYAEQYRRMESSYLPHLCAELAASQPGAALDVGPGWGTMMVWLAGRGWEVTVVDRAPLGQWITQSLLDAAAAAYVHADIVKGPLPGRQFGLVTMTQVLPHLKWHPVRALRNCTRMLAEDGVFLACVLDADDYPEVSPPYGTDWRSVPRFGEGEASAESVVCMYTRQSFEQLLKTVFNQVTVWKPEGSSVLFARAMR